MLPLAFSFVVHLKFNSFWILVINPIRHNNFIINNKISILFLNMTAYTFLIIRHMQRIRYYIYCRILFFFYFRRDKRAWLQLRKSKKFYLSSSTKNLLHRRIFIHSNTYICLTRYNMDNTTASDISFLYVCTAKYYLSLRNLFCFIPLTML